MLSSAIILVFQIFAPPILKYLRVISRFASVIIAKIFLALIRFMSSARILLEIPRKYTTITSKDTTINSIGNLSSFIEMFLDSSRVQ